jgi:hypothetical protein
MSATPVAPPTPAFITAPGSSPLAVAPGSTSAAPPEVLGSAVGAAPAAGETKAAPSVADLKAARRAGAVLPAVAAAAEAAKPPATAEVDIPAEELGRFSKLSAAKRALEQQVKDLAPKAAAAAKLEAAQKLINDGKHLEAMGLLGLDIDRAVAENLGMPPADKKDPALAKLEADQAELKAKLEAREKAEKEGGDAAAAERATKALTDIKTRVEADTATFPYLSTNPAWVDHAMAGANEAYIAITKATGADLPAAEKQKLIQAALLEEEARQVKIFTETQAKIEARRGQSGQGSQGSQSAANGPGLTFDASLRGGSSSGRAPARKLTFDQLKTERRSGRR